MKDKAFFDTNVLAYGFDKNAPEKQKIAQDLVHKWLPSNRMVISTQVLQELFVVLTKRLKPGLPIELARKIIEDFAQVEVVLIEPQTILEAIDIAKKYKIPFWDALIVKAALEARCRVLFTEDLSHGQEIGKLKVVNPFRKD